MLIVAADRRELAPLARRLARPRPLAWPSAWALAGRLRGRSVVLLAAGIGRRRAGAAVVRASERADLSGVVSMGWCGALDPALAVGHVVVADRVITEDGLEFAANPVPGAASRGTVLTAEHFIASVREKRRLRQTGAIAVEMEAAGAASEARRLGLPFHCVRAVSDAAETAIPLATDRLEPEQLTAVRVARRAGFSPGRWAAVFRLWRGAAAASQALADFLEEARFAG